jgi:hypothetical protein
MANELIYSDVLVENSITNSDIDTDEALDNTSPFSFFDFLKNTSGTYTPAEYNVFYTNYLTRWSEIKTGNTPTVEYIADQYIDLLKDISLNFTTEAEKRFLSNIDFENPLDLDVAIPFYTKKIKEIILFYKQKRDTGTFVIERNKIRGTKTSLERAIYESIVSYIFSDDSINDFSLINYNVDSIKRNLEVNVDDFIDVYSNYFDLPRDPVNENTVREELYTFNTNSIRSDVFFNPTDIVTKEVFGNEVRLKEIPLAVNVQLDLNPVCSPTNPFESLVNDDEKDQLGATARNNLRKRFYQKYLGTDFYYLSTNSSVASVSGVFIEADNPTGNLLNLQTADLAGVESDQLEELRNIGLFFKPDKQGLLKVTAKTFTYSINRDALEPDTVYIFPNPSVYGNVSLNRLSAYPLIYAFDIDTERRNASAGFAYGDPRVDSDDQPFLPYYSRQQDKNKFDKREVFIDMSDLYDQGIIRKWQTDVYGNQYAMFKDKFGQYFVQNVDLGTQFVKCLTLDGHVFFDTVEGYNFNYDTYEVVNETTIRSGLTSRTVVSSLCPAFNLTGSPLWLNFRQFYPYQDCGFVALSDASNKCGPKFECGSFTKADSSRLPDPINADLSSYPGSGYYYYDNFLAAGLGQKDPLHRALIDLSAYNANFHITVVNDLSSGNARAYTCGLFTDTISICEAPETLFIDEVDSGSETALADSDGTNAWSAVATYQYLTGDAFVRMSGKTNSVKLSAALSAVIAKYNDYVQSEVNDKLIDFEIVYDSVFLRSRDVLLIDKIQYDETGYITPTTKNTYYTTNSANYFSRFSNLFFREAKNDVTFVVMAEYPVLSGSLNKIIYPNIYRYNITTNKTIKLWPKNTSDVVSASAQYALPFLTSEGATISSEMIAITEPKLVYNTKNGVWKLTYMGRDLNSFPHLFDYTLKERSTYVETVSSRVYTLTTKDNATTNWVAPSAQYITFGFQENTTISPAGICQS